MGFDVVTPCYHLWKARSSDGGQPHGALPGGERCIPRLDAHRLFARSPVGRSAHSGCSSSVVVNRSRRNSGTRGRSGSCDTTVSCYLGSGLGPKSSASNTFANFDDIAGFGRAARLDRVCKKLPRERLHCGAEVSRRPSSCKGHDDLPNVGRHYLRSRIYYDHQLSLRPIGLMT
jgi:hypothetical protein